LTAIVANTSAIIAIIRAEPEARRFIDAIAEADTVYLSAVSLQESAMVLAGRAGDASVWRILDELVQKMVLEVAPHDHDLSIVAREAFLRFGKGRHPAALNCGDCASYALARARNLPLLFKGRDFSQTDIVAVLGQGG
jgi:ribonuclease VapC